LQSAGNQRGEDTNRRSRKRNTRRALLAASAADDGSVPHKCRATRGKNRFAEMRSEGRTANQLRSVRMTTGFIGQAEGSVLIEVGRTRVICTASVEEAVPLFLKGQGKGWITSEYSMIPRATNTRTPRESTLGKKSGRTQEIQRL